ncbi:hypothetical protein BCR36DRAFT_444937, partial [Piromyces finnis]
MVQNLNVKDNNGQILLHFARIDDENYDIAKYLIDSWTLLHYACDKGNETRVKHLIKNEKININIQDDYGHTPIH